MTLISLSTQAQEAARVVLDTNVLLDLLVFKDARSQGLHQALRLGQLQALTTTAMLDELADVLSRPFLSRWRVDAPAVLTQAHSLCRVVENIAPGTVNAPRCADLDDQMFIDLAWSWPARWLFSRDRALLDLARAASLRGLEVLTPAAWAARPVSLGGPIDMANTSAP
jgi:putative PIN family toxin of toxin-antitoxin system